MGYIWTVALGRAPRLPGTKTKGAILPKCWLIRVCPTIESCCGVTQYVTDPKTLLFPFIDFPILRPIDSAPSYLIQNYFICLLNFFTLKIHSVNFCFYWAAYSRGEGGVKAKGPQLELNLWHRVYMQHILKLLAWHCSLFSGSAYLRCSSKWKGAVCVCVFKRITERTNVRQYHTTLFHLATYLWNISTGANFLLSVITVFLHTRTPRKVPQLIGLHFREIISDC